MTGMHGTVVGDRLAAIVGQIYGAAADEDQWTSAATGLRDLMGGICVTHAIVDRRTGAMPRVAILYDDAASLDRYYAEGIHLIDPQAKFAAGQGRTRLWEDRDHVDESDPATAEFCHWVRSNTRIGHHIAASAVVGEGAMMNVLSMHRPRGEGAIPDADRRLMAALLPHLHRASELALLHADKVTQAYWNGMLARHDEAAALVDRDGRVMRLTPALERMLGRGQGLDIVGGRLCAAEPDDDTALRGVVVRSAGPVPMAGAVRVRRGAGAAPLAVTVYPVTRPGPLLSSDAVVAIVTVIDPLDAPARSRLFGQAFGLTPREDDLAGMLLLGHSIESAAAALEISRNTARIHLRRLFAKTRTSRQADLLRLLGRF